MKHHMKKVPEIQLKSDIYHSQEIKEAESLLGKIASPTTPHKPTATNKTTKKKHHRLFSSLHLLRQRFLSLW